MTPFPWPDLFIIAGLILLNGVFAMSELAIVSARTARLSMAADKGSKAAQTALALAADPGKFLSTVQIGITLIGIIAGAYSGASLGGPVGERLAGLGIDADFADDLGFALVIAVTTYASLVIGELVPKQLALRSAETIALAMARPMWLLARVAAPFVWLLDKSSSIIVHLLGIRKKSEHGLSAQELQMIFAEATRTGVIEEESEALLAGVLKLHDRPVRELMTPRTELDWLDRDASVKEIRKAIAASNHSLLPVAAGSSDEVLGVVKVREVLALLLADQDVDLASLMRKPSIIPDQLDALDALRTLQDAEVPMMMVHDEYGHLEGIVTPADLLTAIVGDFASVQDEGEGPMMVERQDGSWLVSGACPADRLADQLSLELADDREFSTAAGFALWVLKKLPKEGELFVDQGWQFEVVDMDGRRIDKLLVTRRDEGG
ncbi:hemolysin family protein [Alteriqipengyuania sp. WL0013]|uniref:hemolysin family protein n=1 Tax=Alteriqipengyuania sp. WL0013 TaxID=3110773 RepID=UPI002BC73C50|nr:hemolysin family protein [Alteriqipengyuania sp. WL0013]MEB3416258.1 hemolysin family protein [Alteriqipengyuania sp. WL0013]